MGRIVKNKCWGNFRKIAGQKIDYEKSNDMVFDDLLISCFSKAKAMHVWFYRNLKNDDFFEKKTNKFYSFTNTSFYNSFFYGAMTNKEAFCDIFASDGGDFVVNYNTKEEYVEKIKDIYTNKVLKNKRYFEIFAYEANFIKSSLKKPCPFYDRLITAKRKNDEIFTRWMGL